LLPEEEAAISADTKLLSAKSSAVPLLLLEEYCAAPLLELLLDSGLDGAGAAVLDAEMAGAAELLTAGLDGSAAAELEAAMITVVVAGVIAMSVVVVVV